MITTMAMVKIIGRLYDKASTVPPTTATAGVVGEILLDTETGLSYELVGVAGSVYTWEQSVAYDLIITETIKKAEVDYLRIRGVPFDTDDGDIVYPSGAQYTAAEMVCYLIGLGDYFGRGANTDTLNGRSTTYEQKVLGYPMSITNSIERFQAAV